MDEFQAAQFHFLVSPLFQYPITLQSDPHLTAYPQSNVCISHMHAINVSLLDEEEANGTSGLDSLPMETMQLEETCKSLSDDEGKAQPQWAAFEGSSGSAKPPLLSPNDEFSLENASSESEASVVDWNPGSRKRKAKPSSPKSRKRNIFPSRATKKATSNKLAANADTSSATLQIRGSRKKLETTANPATASTTAEKSGKAVAEPDTSGRLNLKVADEQDIGMGESDSDDEER